VNAAVGESVTSLHRLPGRVNDDTDGYIGAGDTGAVASADADGEAFKLLGSATRVAILRALVEADDGHVLVTERTFTQLYEASGESTTTDFAYHLRPLVGQFLRREAGGGDEPDTYSLNYAGLQVVRGLAADTHTESVDRAPVPLDNPCPFCAVTGDEAGDGAANRAGDGALELRVRDSQAIVGCGACGQDVLSLPFPPGGFRSHDEDSLLGAFDTDHRHHIALMIDGNCPECAGSVTSAVVPADPAGEPAAGEGLRMGHRSSLPRLTVTPAATCFVARSRSPSGRTPPLSPSRTITGSRSGPDPSGTSARSGASASSPRTRSSSG
jgi:hypothetical protein